MIVCYIASYVLHIPHNNVYIHIHLYKYICMYICIERERVCVCVTYHLSQLAVLTKYVKPQISHQPLLVDWNNPSFSVRAPSHTNSYIDNSGS